MKTQNIKNNKEKGFTLVETMFAVFILTFAVASLMNVVANSLFSAKYSRDEITANYLAQEIVDHIRNDRDTTVFFQDSEASGDAWNLFIAKYSDCDREENNGCFINARDKGSIPQTCSADNWETDVEKGRGCVLYYYDNAPDGVFYSHTTGEAVSNFKRVIVVERNADPNQIDVEVGVSWINGSVARTRTLHTSLLKWQP
jgi:Tfp pilus assembly protein PilV